MHPTKNPPSAKMSPESADGAAMVADTLMAATTAAAIRVFIWLHYTTITFPHSTAARRSGFMV